MAIDGHFANSLHYLLRFCNSFVIFIVAILQQFQVFLMILLFTAFSLVTWGLVGLSTGADPAAGKGGAQIVDQ